MAKRATYTEPTDYFPKTTRKKAGIGEYAKSTKTTKGKSTTKKSTTKKSTKKGK